MYLHEAMQRILEDTGRQMSIQEITVENRRRELFRQKNGDFPDAWQVAARAANKPKKFEVIIRLRK